MENDAQVPPAHPSAEVHEPVEHLKVWVDGTIKLSACRPDGGPVEMDSAQASLVVSLLCDLIEAESSDIPYEPDETGYGALRHEVCVVWGFCGSIKRRQPLHVDFLIPASGPVTADQFVEWVFLADNLNPNLDPERWQPHKDAIRAAFVKHMGAEIVDAHAFGLSDTPPEYDPEVKWRGPLPDVR